MAARHETSRGKSMLRTLLRAMTLQAAPRPGAVTLTAVFTTGFDAEQGQTFTVVSYGSVIRRRSSPHYLLAVYEGATAGGPGTNLLGNTADPERALRMMEGASRGYPILIRTRSGMATQTWYNTRPGQDDFTRAERRNQNAHELAARIIGQAYRLSATRRAVVARRQHTSRMRDGTTGLARLSTRR